MCAIHQCLLSPQIAHVHVRLRLRWLRSEPVDCPPRHPPYPRLYDPPKNILDPTSRRPSNEGVAESPVATVASSRPHLLSTFSPQKNSVLAGQVDSVAQGPLGRSGRLLLLYTLRVYMLQGWYIVTYGLGIYLLNLFIGFLSPQDDPELQGLGLPSGKSEEYRPFTRRVPEFKFWTSCMRPSEWPSA